MTRFLAMAMCPLAPGAARAGLDDAPTRGDGAAGTFTSTYKRCPNFAVTDGGSNGVFFADGGVSGVSVAVPFVVENAAAFPRGTGAAPANTARGPKVSREGDVLSSRIKPEGATPLVQITGTLVPS